MNISSSPGTLNEGTAPETPHTATVLPRRFFGIVLAVLLLAVLFNFLLQRLRPHEFYGTRLQATTPVSDFQLDTSAGHLMHLTDFRGKYVLLYFGYTFCPDACPLTLNDLADMMTALGDKAANVQVIFVSIDPERDSVEQLVSYLPHFNPTFLGMTGDPDIIRGAATQFGIFYEKRGETVGYTMDHTSTVAVIDPDGYLALLFPFGTSGEQMASDLTYLGVAR
ncbi:MAG: SCO family protein [Caldilineaceae bacterium]